VPPQLEKQRQQKLPNLNDLTQTASKKECCVPKKHAEKIHRCTPEQSQHHSQKTILRLQIKQQASQLKPGRSWELGIACHL
jgi:hypothetical protein